MILAILGSEKKLHYKYYSYFIIDGDLKKEVARLNVSILNRILSHNRLVSRLLRLEPRCCEKISTDKFVICHLKKIWLLDINAKTLMVLSASRTGFTTPLNLCSANEHVYWGDYGSNTNHDNVNVYCLDQGLEKSTVYSFPANTIRHIHNIIYDEDRKKYWILTGDNEATSGIYLASEDWKDVKPIATGEQLYRAVVGFPHPKGLLFATDSVEKDNYLCLLNLETKKVNKLFAMNGSCIYGGKTKDYDVFSTTVESPEGGGIWSMFSRKLGKGIKNYEVKIISVKRSDNSIIEIASLTKDFWPMKLFQYGQATFPIGMEFSNKLYFNPIACKGADGVVKEILIDE